MTAQSSVKNKLLKITNREIDGVLADRTWDLGNKVLYELCRKYPHHIKPNEVIAKVWLIGRAYAAAIERRKKATSKSKGDLFYTGTVAPKIIEEKIDRWVGSAIAKNAIEVHYKLTHLFRKISKHQKRSLASKYLHFHRPGIFFIYDSRSVAATRSLPLVDWPLPKTYDREYALFYRRCLWLREYFWRKFGRKLSPRELDKILLYATDSRKI